ncbi:MAG: hypothetical protein ABF753_03315 [Lentilactobacillus hilgardii]|uniref:hypothetical protein n=1 Tax=Lentilactobacillus hilgardii TaxID=1588 RepID=UPI0039ED5FF4
MANTRGYRRKKLRKHKREEHCEISIDACGNVADVSKCVKAIEAKMSEQIVREFKKINEQA